MVDFPANYDAALFDEEQRGVGRHWLRLGMIAPGLTARIFRYIYTQPEPSLSRFVDSLEATQERDELRARFGFPAAVRSPEARRKLRLAMGPATFSDLASLFREMPHLEEFNLWRRRAEPSRGSIDFEGKELLAAYAKDVIESNQALYGRGMGLGWGPWPDLREVGVSTNGNAPLQGGGFVHYCKQFAFWGTEPLETMLAAHDPYATSQLGIWEFCLQEEAGSPFWIGLHQADENLHTVHMYQLVVGVNAFARIILVVFHIELHLPTIHATAFIDLVHRKLSSNGTIYAKHRRVSSLRPDPADLKRGGGIMTSRTDFDNNDDKHEHHDPDCCFDFVIHADHGTVFM